MSASQIEYKKLIAEFYQKKVKNCQACQGLNPTCHCMEKFEKLCAIANARIPFKLRYAKIEDFVVESDIEEKQIVQKYIKHIGEMRRRGIGMWIHGDPKTGKTFLMCSILTGAIESGFSAYYLDVNEFYRIQEIRYSDQNENYRKKMTILHRTDFLAIDGFGFTAQGGKPAGKAALANLFQQRIDAKKPTLLGSIMSDLKDLSMISPELSSLTQEGCPIEVSLSGSDFVEQEALAKKSFFKSLPE